MDRKPDFEQFQRELSDLQMRWGFLIRAKYSTEELSSKSGGRWLQVKAEIEYVDLGYSTPPPATNEPTSEAIQHVEESASPQPQNGSAK